MGGSLKTQRWLRAAVGTLALAAIVFYAMAIVVAEGQAVLVTRFGRPLRAATETGLHWKLPWPIDRASWLDMRRRVYETGHTEMLTRDKKNIIARTFVVWRIGDPLAFTQAIGNESGAEAKLDGLLTNAAIGTLGGHDLSALVSTNPAICRWTKSSPSFWVNRACGPAELWRCHRPDSARTHRVA